VVLSSSFFRRQYHRPYLFLVIFLSLDLRLWVTSNSNFSSSADSLCLSSLSILVFKILHISSMRLIMLFSLNSNAICPFPHLPVSIRPHVGSSNNCCFTVPLLTSLVLNLIKALNSRTVNPILVHDKWTVNMKRHKSFHFVNYHLCSSLNMIL